jgi:hypothetical protein
MRGIRLDELVDRLRAEVGHSTNAQVGQNSYDYLVQVLSRTQRRLCEEYDWAHLKIKRDIAVEAGQRYYPTPDSLHYERITDVEFKDGSLWRPLIRGVDESLFSMHDSDRGHQNWPLQHWDVHENLDGPADTTGFLEFWPIPNRSASQFDGIVRLTGYMQAPELTHPNDKCVLDGSLLVLYAASEICARQNQSDAQMKLTAAQQLMSRLQNQNSNKKKYVSFSPNASVQGKNPWRQRNIIGVSRSGGGEGSGGGIGDAPADGECYARKDYEWVTITSCGGSDGGIDVEDGSLSGTTLRWDTDTGEWIENTALRSSGENSIQIHDDYDLNAWRFRSFRLPNAYDPWLDETKNFNVHVIEPFNAQGQNGVEKYALSMLADRFTVRSGPTSEDATTQGVAFRVDNTQVDIGLRNHTTNTFVNGDCYVGMSSNMYGVDLPFNSDSAPGTLFAGGIAMTGTYLDGESLVPLGNETGENVIDRAFAKDAALNMNGNRLYGLPVPTNPSDAVSLAYFNANAGEGNGAADNVANATVAGQMLAWDGTSKYQPTDFVKLLDGPERLESPRIRVTGAPSDPSDVINKQALEDYVAKGDDGSTLRWDADLQGYVKNSDLVRVSNTAYSHIMRKGLVLQEQSSDDIGYALVQSQYTQVSDPWTGGIINLNSLQIQPYNDVPNSGYESGIAMLADRFTVRVPAIGDDPYDGEIAFRVRKLEAVVGVDSKETSVILQGDTYIGYERTNRPDNNDKELGTLFIGRGIFVGKGLAAGDCSINMGSNIISYLADPVNDTCAMPKGYADARYIRSDNATLKQLTVSGTATFNGRTVISADATIGKDETSTVQVRGDTYIGYAGVGLPDTGSDDVAGTLFIGRGINVGVFAQGEQANPVSIKMNGNKIYELPEPVGATEAATKGYVDALIDSVEAGEASIPDDLQVKTLGVENGANLLSSNTIGSANTDNQRLVGDVYVGYELGDSLPSQGDPAAGTLMLGRGAIVGLGKTAGSASINMNGNIIYDLPDTTAASGGKTAVNKNYVDLKVLEAKTDGSYPKSADFDSVIVNGSLNTETLRVIGTTWLGNSGVDQTISTGDTYIGYINNPRPNSPDTDENGNPIGGTLFCERGISIGGFRAVGTASINMNSNFIYNVPSPEATHHVANKAYVDQAVEGANRADLENISSETITVNNSLISNNVTKLNGNTWIGNSYTDELVISGDTYIGYTSSTNRPSSNNSDEVAGTLFCERGISIGGARTAGTASINMNGNKIYGAALIPESNNELVSKYYTDQTFLKKNPSSLSVSTFSCSGASSFNGTTNISADAYIGKNNASTVQINGDTYIGYETSLPNNDDSVGGTLFSARGIQIGRGVAAGTASIGMNDNYIYDVRYPTASNHVPNVQWCSDVFVQKNRSNDLAAAAISAIESATDLDSVKAAMIKMLKEQMKDDNAMPTGIAD